MRPVSRSAKPCIKVQPLEQVNDVPTAEPQSENNSDDNVEDSEAEAEPLAPTNNEEMITRGQSNNPMVCFSQSVATCLTICVSSPGS